MMFRFEPISRCFRSADRLPASVESEVYRLQLGQLSANQAYGQTSGGLLGSCRGTAFRVLGERGWVTGNPNGGGNRGETAEIRCDPPNRHEPGPIHGRPRQENGLVSQCLLE